MTPEAEEHILEQQLLAIGAQERLVQQQIQDIKARMKAAVAAGNLADADAAWDIYEELRKALALVQAQADIAERAYYNRRRLRRR